MAHNPDNRTFFMEEVRPLLMQLQQMCNEKKIPYFAAFGLHMNNKKKYDVGEDGLYAMTLIPEVLSLDCNDTIFAEFLNLLNGAHTVYTTQGSIDEEQNLWSAEEA